jgi:hypothetical protein
VSDGLNQGKYCGMGKSPKDKNKGVQLRYQLKPLALTDNVSASADDEVVNLSFKVTSAFRNAFQAGRYSCGNYPE